MAVGKNFIDEIIGEYDMLAMTLRTEAELRREPDPGDIPANVYERIAVRIEKLGTMIHEKMDLVTVQEYAELNNITPQTVRRWCSMGQLTYFTTDKGMLVLRHARRNPEIRGDS